MLLPSQLGRQPKESKETAPGFRGTRLCWQSLVCYTFVQQMAAEGELSRPAPLCERCPYGVA